MQKKLLRKTALTSLLGLAFLGQLMSTKVQAGRVDDVEELGVARERAMPPKSTYTFYDGPVRYYNCGVAWNKDDLSGAKAACTTCATNLVNDKSSDINSKFSGCREEHWISTAINTDNLKRLQIVVQMIKQWKPKFVVTLQESKNEDWNKTLSELKTAAVKRDAEELRQKQAESERVELERIEAERAAAEQAKYLNYMEVGRLAMFPPEGFQRTARALQGRWESYGRAVTFHEYESPADPESGFLILGLTRPQAVEQILQAYEKRIFRDFIFAEIKGAVMNGTMPDAMKADPDYIKLEEVKKLAHEIGDSKALNDKLAQRVTEYCSQEDVVKAYITQHVGTTGRLKHLQDSPSIFDALARLNKFSVYIWGATPERADSVDLRYQIQNMAARKVLHLLQPEGTDRYNILEVLDADLDGDAELAAAIEHATLSPVGDPGAIEVGDFADAASEVAKALAKVADGEDPAPKEDQNAG